jgi:hypothetical protein
MNDKNISYVVLGIVAVIAVVSLIVLFKSATVGKVVTGDVPLMPGPKIYGGAIKGEPLPYLVDRTVIGGVKNVEEGVHVLSVKDAANRHPSRSALQDRTPSRIYALLDSCEGLIIQGLLPEMFIYEAGWQEAVSRYGLNNCIDTRDQIAQLCCQRADNIYK